jgi:hypothetical protein
MSKARQANPYVGPRAFARGETLYGRDREAKKLLDILIAERIVLLYSPSGAGKTSLIHARLIPALEAEEFHVLPVMRVSAETPRSDDFDSASTNRYLLSLLLSLEEHLPPEQQTPLSELASMSLETYLAQRPRPAESSAEVLIFDQFEELLTIDPTNHAAREAFFAQVGTALRDRSRWALFAMREDFIASLDPYVRRIPTRLSTTFRLDLLDVQGARLAVQQPPAQVGVTFSDTATERLIDDLRRMRVQQPDGSVIEQPGTTVEPVQLQVVCYRLWERLPAGASEISEQDIAALGDVNSALADYYAERVAEAASSSGLRERHIRDWVEQHLITDQDIRGQVLQQTDQSEGLDNRAIAMLIDAHLVRAENRRGAIWYELTHDRLIEPIRASNAAWREVHLNMLQHQAALWESQQRPADMLLRGESLQRAEAWSQENPDDLTESERAFLQASQQARDAATRERRTNQLIRTLAAVAAIASIIAIVAGLSAFSSWQELLATGRQLDKARQTSVAAQNNLDGLREEWIGIQSSAIASEGMGEPPAIRTAYAIRAQELATAVHESGKTATRVKGTEEALEEDQITLLYPAPTLTVLAASSTRQAREEARTATAYPLVGTPILRTATRTRTPRPTSTDTTGPTSARTAIARERTATAQAESTMTAQAQPYTTPLPPPTPEAPGGEPSPYPPPQNTTPTSTATLTTTLTTVSPTLENYP